MYQRGFFFRDIPSELMTILHSKAKVTILLKYSLMDPPLREGAGTQRPPPHTQLQA